jgi:hypothetical protein
MFAGLMPGSSTIAALGSSDGGAPVRAAVDTDGTGCDAVGTAADALHPAVGMADCRNATFTLEFHATLYPEVGVGDPRPVTLGLGATRVRGVWFRLYCEGQSCPTQFPGGPE